MESKEFDLVVVGAGAAGLVAAGTAARNGARVLLLEKMEKPARKVRITGKGRCNLTNARPPEEFCQKVRANADFFAPAFAEFNNLATIRFFERRKVKLEVERGERVFPKSGRAGEIADALEFYCRDHEVTIECNARVTGIVTVNNKVYGVEYRNKRGFSRKVETRNVIIATGGVSYPATGSTGDGYRFADELGHDVEPVRPSLTPLVTSHPQREYLNGLLLRNVGAKLFIDNQLTREEFGEIGFSERGVEGAVALRFSRDAVDALIDDRKVKIVLDLKPALDEQTLRDRIAREIAESDPQEFFGDLLRRLVPKQLVVPMAKELDVHSKLYISKLTEKETERLIKVLKGFVLPITDYAPFEYAIVTAGGVSCSDINPETLESRKVKGLYFAGEVLDIDADTGGYNLQIAFSTGYLAGQLKK